MWIKGWIILFKRLGRLLARWGVAYAKYLRENPNAIPPCYRDIFKLFWYAYKCPPDDITGGVTMGPLPDIRHSPSFTGIRIGADYDFVDLSGLKRSTTGSMTSRQYRATIANAMTK